MRAILAAVIVAACTMTGALAECRGALVKLHIAKDGTVSWNDVAFKSEKEMIDRFWREASVADQPKILFLPLRGIDDARAYAVLMEVQKAGLLCVGFGGFEQKRAN